MSVVRPLVNWQFRLADTATMTPICDLEPQVAVDLGVQLNRGGSLGTTLSTRSESGTKVRRGLTCVLAIRDGVTVWSGPVWTVQAGLSAQTIQIGCVGWIEFLAYRLLYPTQKTLALGYPLTNVDIITQAWWLLARANEQGFTIIGAPSSTFITQGAADTSGDDGVNNYVPVFATAAWSDWANIGNEIQTLSDMENGFDYGVDTVTRQLNIWHPRFGNDFSGDNGIAFGFQSGPNNLADVQISEDQSKYVNRVNALGKSRWEMAQDLTQQAEYGLFESQVSLSDQDNPDVLLAYAGAEVLVKEFPISYTLSVLPATDQNRVPRPFDELNVGDFFAFSANEGQYYYDKKKARNFGMGVQIDTEGSESITSLTTELSST